tara:strand:- start:1836 stop:2318 length:483 start_codon:yes stop_codon:yes gene_type:complete
MVTNAKTTKTKTTKTKTKVKKTKTKVKKVDKTKVVEKVTTQQKGKRRFSLVDPVYWKKTDPLSAFYGKTPRSAALKAATRNFTEITLIERNRAKKRIRVHQFEGGKKALEEERITEFTKKHNIQFRPYVKKLGMFTLPGKDYRTLIKANTPVSEYLTKKV